MIDCHFGSDYDMWLYHDVDWTNPDFYYGLPDQIEAVDIDDTILVNAEDAIEQVRKLKAENFKLRELASVAICHMTCCKTNHLYLQQNRTKEQVEIFISFWTKSKD